MKTFKLHIKHIYLPFLWCIFFAQNICAQNTVFYGMTSAGGGSSYGEIFNFDPSNSLVSWSYGFRSGSDGATPSGSLVYNTRDGLFYGMTTQGGEYNYGAIFSFNPSDQKDSVLWSFHGGADGANPSGSLVFDSSNNMFYGMTYAGGSDTLGAIISFNPSTGRDSVLWSFQFGTDGAYPEGDFVYDPDNGLLYGMTAYGGIYGWGTILSLDPNTGRDSVLWSLGARLNGTGVTIDGADPFYGSKLVYDPDNGLLYATTAGGGIYYGGALISFDPASGKDSLLWSFGNGNDGWNPYGSLLYDKNNKLFYGMTLSGGDSGLGIIFSFDPSSNSEKVLWSFEGSPDDVAQPQGGNLIIDPQSGLLYGMADGGLNNLGGIFSFNISNNTENVIWDFSGGWDGALPDGSLVIYPPSYTGINALDNTLKINIYPNPNAGIIHISGIYRGQIIKIYDYTGQEVNCLIANNTEEQIDISAQQNAIYLIEVINIDGTIAANKKVVKMN